MPRPRVGEGGINLKPSGRMPSAPAPAAGAGEPPAEPAAIENPVFSCRDVNVFYGATHALKNVLHRCRAPPGAGGDRPLGLRQVDVPALPEPDERHHCRRARDRRHQARRREIHRRRRSTSVQLRARVGMVFQKPNPFPKSIHDNVPTARASTGSRSAAPSSTTSCARALTRAGLWDEVKDRLHAEPVPGSPAVSSSGCASRARIAVQPEVILMDEPCSALDPVATARIEDLIDELKRAYAIVIVTHSMQQAARVSQRTAYFHLGRARRGRRHRPGVHQPAPPPYRGLHHGPLRLGSQKRRRPGPPVQTRTPADFRT